MAWVLELALTDVTTGERQTRTFEVSGEPIILGRSGATICVAPRGNAARRNTELRVTADGQVVVKDLGTGQGTVLNGRKITQPHELRPSDVIVVGDFSIQLLRVVRAGLRALDDASLLRAIAELYTPGAPEPELAPLCAALAGREVTIAVPGGRVRVDLGDWTSILMVRLGAWEPHLLGLARALLRDRRNAVAIDVGAHVGTWTMLLASLVGPAGRVIACEPFAPSAARARAMVEAAELGERVRVIETAIGDRAGTARLYAAGDSMLRSLVPKAGVTDDREVPLATLDGLGVERADVIKIDTEGFELAVLRGGSELLARSDPALIIELHAAELRAQGTSTAEVQAFLRARGFTVFDLRPEGTELVVEPLREHPTTHHILARRDPAGFTVPLR